MKKELMNHLTSCGEHHVKMAKCYGKMAGFHNTMAKIAMDSNKAAGDELAKSYHEACADCHKSMAGQCEEMASEHADHAGHYVEMAKAVDGMNEESIPRNAGAMGSTDFRPGSKATGSLEGESDILEMLRKLDRSLDQVVPDSVRGVIPEGLEMVTRNGSPSADVPDSRLDSIAVSMFGGA